MYALLLPCDAIAATERPIDPVSGVANDHCRTWICCSSQWRIVLRRSIGDCRNCQVAFCEERGKGVSIVHPPGFDDLPIELDTEAWIIRRVEQAMLDARRWDHDVALIAERSRMSRRDRGGSRPPRRGARQRPCQSQVRPGFR